MDNNYKKSLILKIANKGVITPYEAIHLQHLNNQYRKKQIANLQPSENIYEDYENIEPLIPGYLLDHILSFTQKQDCDLYNAYNWVANDITNLEKAIGEIGYKGIALLNEIKYARDEWCIRAIEDIDLKRPAREKIMEYEVYSRVNQKRITFTEILESLGITLSTLMISIDIILTNNYYLQNLFELEDLNCLKYLKMWLKEENYEGMTTEDKEEELPPFYLIKGCFENGDMYFIFDENHPKNIGLMRNRIDSFGLNLPSDFEQNSLNYVKETVKKIVDSTPSPNLRIADLHEP